MDRKLNTYKVLNMVVKTTIMFLVLNMVDLVKTTKMFLV